MKRTADFVKNLEFHKLNGSTIRRAKDCLLDFIGAVLGGARAKAGEISLSVAKSLGGREEVTIWPTKEKVSWQAAAFAHGTMGTTLDVDDGHRVGRGHPGSVVIPAAFSIAEKNQNTGKELIEAVVCGYEVGIRVGHVLRIQNPHLLSLGSGRWGSTGAAAAVAKLLHLNLEQIEQALAVSATFAPVAPVTEDLETKGSVPMTKFSSGWGAVVGIWSALLAKHGFTGVSSTIDFSLSSLPGYGESFEIENVYFKPYTACRWTHSAIEGTVQLMREHNELKRENINKICITTFRDACRLGERRPRTMESAQYSIPFVVGAAIADGEVGPDQVNEGRLSDPNILSIADKVEIIHSPELDDYFPRMAPCEVEIEAMSGRFYRTRITRPRGDPGNPMSEEELVDKFRRLATESVSLEASERVKETIERLDELSDLKELTDIFQEQASDG